jgi:hypothetical protein
MNVAIQNELQNQYKTHQRSGPLQPCSARAHNGAAMGFNKRKMEDDRRQATEQAAAARRATDRQILDDAEQLVTAWNERQAKRMPMLFSPTIGAAVRPLPRRCRADPADRMCRSPNLPVQVERGGGVLRGAQRQSVGERVNGGQGHSEGMSRVSRWARALPSLRTLLLHRGLATIDDQAVALSTALAAYGSVPQS